jgi:hypothetical protein
MTRFLDAAALRALASAAADAGADVGCARCAVLASPGWESMPAGFDASALREIGTLRAPPADPEQPDEPCWDEYHPQGTRMGSPDAPIAPRFHPYNRCNVNACNGCGRLFLRYTEFGGYYIDHRVREMNLALLVA